MDETWRASASEMQGSALRACHKSVRSVHFQAKAKAKKKKFIINKIRSFNFVHLNA
jgi:hypothetical protein